MEAYSIIGLVIALLVVAVGVRAIIRHEQRKHQSMLPKRGTHPGDDEQLIYAGETMPTGHGNFDASRVYRVSRNPNDHARAMMPAKARKDKTK